jgi:hypothetical protein
MQTSTPSFPRLNVRSTTIFHYYLNEPSEYETSLEVIYRWNGRSGWIDTGSFWRRYDHLARRRVWGLNSADMFPNRYSDSLTRLFQNRISGRFARCCIIIRKRHVIDKDPKTYTIMYSKIYQMFSSDLEFHSSLDDMWWKHDEAPQPQGLCMITWCRSNFSHLWSLSEISCSNDLKDSQQVRTPASSITYATPRWLLENLIE